MKTRVLLLLFLVVTLVVGCSQANTQQSPNLGYTAVTEATLKVGDPVPVPVGDVVLTIEGKIRTTNVNNRLEFDMQTLEQLGLITYLVDDPDLKREAKYTGVLLSRLLEIAGMEADAKELGTTALNDYKINIPLDILKWPVMVATMRDGARMSIEEKGPLEIVFPNKSFQIDPIPTNPMWVWSLYHIKVQ